MQDERSARAGPERYVERVPVIRPNPPIGNPTGSAMTMFPFQHLLGALCAARLLVPLDLPVAGLRVELPADGPLDAGVLAVESAWDADGGADWVLAGGERRYRVDVMGRTASDCPLVGSDVREIGGVDWVVSGATSCRLLGESRLRIERLGPPLNGEDTLFALLGESFETRRTTLAKPPPATGPVGGPTTLPVTGLPITLPGDALWRVSPAGDRDHDGLVRLVPAMPEVQVVVRRHTKSELPSCEAMRRRLLAGGWSPLDPNQHISKIEIFDALARNRFAEFESIAWCAERPTELLDVRVASLPRTEATSITSLFQALAATAASPVGDSTRAALPSVLARRDAAEIFEGSLLGVLGVLVDRDETKRVAGAQPDSNSPVLVGAAARFAWALRDGLSVTARGRVGHDGALAWGASLEVGASLIVADDLALVLALGWHEHRDRLLENRALGLSVELRRGWFATQGMRWSLLVSGINLASETPRVLGAPLELTWQGEVFSRLQLGLSLRTAPAGLRDSGDGLELGLRLGWGALWR